MKDTTFDKYCLVVDQWFVNGFNGTQAVKKVYPNHDENAAGVKWNELLRIAKIQGYIESKQKDIREKAQITHLDVLRELKEFALLDTTEIVKIGEKKAFNETTNEEGELVVETMITYGLIVKDFDDLTPIQRRSIQSVKETRNGIEITFFPKQTAFEMINKHIGFYEVDNKQKNTPNEIIEVKIISKDDKPS